MPRKSTIRPFMCCLITRYTARPLALRLDESFGPDAVLRPLAECDKKFEGRE